MLTKDVELHQWPGGCSWRAVVYDEEREHVGYWYGTREECEAVDPATVVLYSIIAGDSPDDFDLACERRHD